MQHHTDIQINNCLFHMHLYILTLFPQWRQLETGIRKLCRSWAFPGLVSGPCRYILHELLFLTAMLVAEYGNHRCWTWKMQKRNVTNENVFIIHYASFTLTPLFFSSICTDSMFFPLFWNLKYLTNISQSYVILMSICSNRHILPEIT